jgi:PIN domain nuclease of toxin-antitoxin system
VKALLDTNVFLWCIAGRKSRLSRRAAKVVEDEDTELLLSAVSIWEIALKARAGKLEIPEGKSFFQEQIGLLRIQFVLAVEATHVFELFTLPDHHRDPFDRLLIAQCIAERFR